MTKILQFISIFIFIPQLYAQTFRMNYNVALLDLPGNAVEAFSANNYVFAGSNVNFIPIVGTVTQINSIGDIVWSKRYSDGSFSTQLNDIKRDDVLSEYFACGGGGNGAIIMRLSSVGNIVASRQFSISEATGGAYFNRVIKTSDGGYLAVGAVTTYDPDGAGAEIRFDPVAHADAGNGCSETDYIDSPLIVKFNSDLTHAWHKVFRYYKTSVAAANRIYNDASYADVVEISDGYIAVGNYEVENIGLSYNTDCDDTTPDDAIITKFTTAGVITYNKQIDALSTSTAQSSKYLTAISKTSTGNPIIAGGDNSRIRVLKLPSSGGWAAPLINKNITYPGFAAVADPSQIYEVSGGTDIVLMSMYISPFSFTFANAMHRVNPAVTANVWARTYTFGIATLLPRGSQTADGGWVAISTAMGASFDYHIFRTDNVGNINSTDCPPGTLNPSFANPAATFGDPLYQAFTGTVNNAVRTLTVASITPAKNIQCTSPLPVELTDFTVNQVKNYNLLKWETVSEVNNAFFILERSQNLTHWTEVAKIDGAGNSYNHNRYSFHDFTYPNSLNYYRLTQVDFDGQTENFNPIAIDNSQSVRLVKITDLLGRTVDEHYSGMQIRYYSNGSFMKISNP